MSSKRLIHALPVVSLFLVLLLNIPKISAQKLDSLEQLLAVQKNSEEKVQTLILISIEYLKTNPSQSLDYANEAYDLAKSLNAIEYEIDAMYQISAAYKDKGIFDSAYIVNRQAIKLCELVNDSKRLADNTLMTGGVLFRYKGPNVARPFFHESLVLYKKLADSTGIANALNGIGAAYMRTGVYDSAINYYHKVISISEKSGSLDGMAKGYINLGIAYLEIWHPEMAKTYLLKSIPVSEKLNKRRFVALAYNNLGSVANDQGDFELSFEYYTKGLNIYTELNNLLGVANLSNNIGTIYEKWKDYVKAKEMFEKAKILYNDIGDKDGYLAAMKNIGLLYERQKDYNRALIIYDSCLRIARDINSIYRIRELYNDIYRVHDLRLDYKNALDYFVLQNEIKDSIFNIEKSATISELEIKYEKEKDQAQILELEKENLEKDLRIRTRTNQRNTYLYMVVGIICLVIFIAIYFRLKARKDRIITEQRIRQLEEEKKLLAAKYLVEGQDEERKRMAKELHDGLGVLLSTAKMQFTTIKDKSPENRPLIDKATKLLEQAAGDVRKISHNMMPGLLTKFGLFEAVEELIDHVNESEQISASCKIKGEIRRLAENTEIMVYRIIQELINNTLKHASAKNMVLQINILSDKLEINYSDDGKGFKVEEKLGSKSIGLQSIQSRIYFLNGGLYIDSESGKGARFNIEIPL